MDSYIIELIEDSRDLEMYKREQALIEKDLIQLLQRKRAFIERDRIEELLRKYFNTRESDYAYIEQEF